jgi:hypothetical protein
MLVMLRIVDTDSLNQIAAFIVAMKLSFKLFTGQTDLTNHYLIAQFAGTKACSRYDLPLYCSTVLLPVMVDQTSVFLGFVAPGSNISTTVSLKRKCKSNSKQRKRLREKRELSSNTDTSTTDIYLDVQDAVVAVKVNDQSSKKKCRENSKQREKIKEVKAAQAAQEAEEVKEVKEVKETKEVNGLGATSGGRSASAGRLRSA